MIELEGLPELVDPVMICAFEGWNDAGDAASSAVGHLDREWKGEVFASLDAEDYYDFQVNRPTVTLHGGVRKVTWPTTQLSAVRIADADGKGNPRDLVLVRGIEPSMRWRSFCNEILGFAHELGVELVVLLGALLGDTPHTRPVPVTGVTSDPELAVSMDLEETRYEGPTGIVGILQEACTHAGVPTASLWAAVPHYVSQPPNPKATLALLNRLDDLIGVRIPLGELPEDARAWQVGVDQLAAEDSEVAEYVQTLEEARDTAELPEASGEAIAREFERYLRRRDPGAGPYLRDLSGPQPLTDREEPRAPQERDGDGEDGGGTDEAEGAAEPEEDGAGQDSGTAEDDGDTGDSGAAEGSDGPEDSDGSDRGAGEDASDDGDADTDADAGSDDGKRPGRDGEGEAGGKD
ncbi:PAC2 family protein [Streptomyces sp. NBC_01808]|uniref:PAC2 family protein n=1 Tax=Streptomyces sp. NBC_01808 TaxID=2975947 RepID=UPI002DD7ED63|nr:PAC2 family protein [Streptomyces sp. NBC_01808]WSA36862.1 PAC2 family protein [Streptomyces sp. NBC_01808]